MKWTFKERVVVPLLRSEIVCSSSCVHFISSLVLVPVLSISIIVISMISVIVIIPKRFSSVFVSGFVAFVVSVAIFSEFAFLLHCY